MTARPRAVAAGPTPGSRARVREQAYLREVGGRLTVARTVRRWSLVKAASMSGVHERVIGTYERGERAMSLPKLAMLAAAYGQPVGSFLPDLDDTRITIAFLAAEAHAATDRLAAAVARQSGQVEQ